MKNMLNVLYSLYLYYCIVKILKNCIFFIWNFFYSHQNNKLYENEVNILKIFNVNAYDCCILSNLIKKELR